MRPGAVAPFDTTLRGDLLPEGRRLAHALGAQLHAQQRLEGAFRRAAHRALAPHHLTKLLDMRNVRHAGAPRHAIHPALDKRHQRLQRDQRLTLLGRIGDAHLGQVHRAGDRLRIHRARIAKLLLHRVEIDGDATRVFADQRLEPRHQPRHSCEQTGVRDFAQRQERRHLRDGDVERRRVFLDVLHDQSARGVLEQRDALVEAAVDLVRQVSRGVPQLHGE